MVNIVDGQRVASEILSKLKKDVIKLNAAGVVPTLAVFQVGDDPVSLSYIKVKTKKAEEIGIKVIVNTINESIGQSELEEKISEASADPSNHAILVQLPLPNHIDKERVLNLIPTEKDVDSLSQSSKRAVINGESNIFFPPAAQAVMKILDHHKVELKGKNIVIVGTGDLVGRPLAAIMLSLELSFELANRYTENLPDLLAEADIVVSGVGKANLIRGEMIREDAVVIDAGTTGSMSGVITGDVERESVEEKASLLAAVPGGVGPVTVAMLLKNVMDAASHSLT